MGNKFFKFFIIFSFILLAFSSAAKADAGYAETIIKQGESVDMKKPSMACTECECAEMSSDELLLPQKDTTKKIFSLGRGVGASYYHLIDLCDKSKNKPFKELQQEYNDTFQNLNIIDIILDDIDIHGKSRQNLDTLRINFYNALKNQDLSEIKLAFVRDMFVVFYENLAADIYRKNCFQGNWIL